MEAQTWQRQFIIDLFDPIILERLGCAVQWKRIQIKATFSLFLKVPMASLYPMHINKCADQFKALFLFWEQRGKSTFIPSIPNLSKQYELMVLTALENCAVRREGSTSSPAQWALHCLKSQERSFKGRQGILFVCFREFTPCQSDGIPGRTRLKSWWLPAPTTPALSESPAQEKQQRNTNKMAKPWGKYW